MMNMHKTQNVGLILAGLLAGLAGAVLADALPSISQRVDEFNQQRMKDSNGPPMSEEDMAFMQKAAADIAAGLPEPGLKIGSKAPDFTLGNAHGKSVSLYEKLKKGPVILAFYRGAWCPYCNIELHALQESLPAFHKYHAQVIAVSPQTPDKSLQQVTKDKFPFEVLSDVNDTVSKAYRLYYEIPKELHEFYKTKFKLDIEAYNGKGRLGLPVPGTFVIDQQGKIVAAFAEHDYQKRMEPADIVAALKSIK